MALQKSKLTPLLQLPSSVAAIYTNPTSTKTLVRGFLLHNTNGTAETVTLHWVESATSGVGTPAAANRIFKVTLQPDETLLIEVPFCLILDTYQDTIQGVTTTASKVNYAVIGDTDV